MKCNVLSAKEIFCDIYLNAEHKPQIDAEMERVERDGAGVLEGVNKGGNFHITDVKTAITLAAARKLGHSHFEVQEREEVVKKKTTPSPAPTPPNANPITLNGMPFRDFLDIANEVPRRRVAWARPAVPTVRRPGRI